MGAACAGNTAVTDNVEVRQETGRSGRMNNILLLTDSYKTSHWKQYPPGTEYVYSYFESRGGKFDEIVFFGLQYFIQRYLAGVVVTEEKIAYAKEMLDCHMGPGHFNE